MAMHIRTSLASTREVALGCKGSPVVDTRARIPIGLAETGKTALSQPRPDNKQSVIHSQYRTRYSRLDEQFACRYPQGSEYQASGRPAYLCLANQPA